MREGSLVKDWLTERMGIVMEIGYMFEDGLTPSRDLERKIPLDPRVYRVEVLWVTQGLSSPVGVREWMRAGSLEVISESR